MPLLIPLYRYLDSDAALKTIVAGRFRVGKPSSFNDPFEWNLGLTGAATKEEQEIARNFSIKHYQWLESWMGILSFSSKISDPTLWSFYAEKHAGAAFEIQHPWEEDHFIKVGYGSERPVLDFQRLRQFRGKDEENKYLVEILDRLMRRKSPSWEFEHEYRIHINLADKTFCEFFSGRHHWQIPAVAFKRLILGFQCPLREEHVRKLLDMNGFIETKVVRARMCMETYTILIDS